MLHSVHSIWFVKYVFSAKIWFVKTQLELWNTNHDLLNWTLFLFWFLFIKQNQSNKPTIKIWISILILIFSYIFHIKFFILQNKGKYIANSYDWPFCFNYQCILINWPHLGQVFPIFKAVYCIDISVFQVAVQKTFQNLVLVLQQQKHLLIISFFFQKYLIFEQKKNLVVLCLNLNSHTFLTVFWHKHIYKDELYCQQDCVRWILFDLSI